MGKNFKYNGWPRVQCMHMGAGQGLAVLVLVLVQSYCMVGVYCNWLQSRRCRWGNRGLPRVHVCARAYFACNCHAGLIYRYRYRWATRTPQNKCTKLTCIKQSRHCHDLVSICFIIITHVFPHYCHFLTFFSDTLGLKGLALFPLTLVYLPPSFSR